MTAGTACAMSTEAPLGQSVVVLCYRTNGRLAPVRHLHRVHHMADGAMLGTENLQVASGLQHGQIIVHDA